MYLYFWQHARDWKEISEKVRSKLIVNTTTAIKGHKEKIPLYRINTPPSIRKELDSYQETLKEKKKVKAGKKAYENLIYPYFYQMTNVLKSAFAVLKPKSPAHIIVSDAALYGVHIKTQHILATIMDIIGYNNITITKLRSRGTRWQLKKREGSKEGLGEYHIRGYS
jgi:hypothetical protein